MDKKTCFSNLTARILTLAIVATGCLGAAIANGQILVPTNAVWKFLDNGTDQGTAWWQPGFNDSSWPSGPAELGFGDALDGRPEATLLNPGPAAPNHYITYYFRRHFTVSGAAAITNLLARVMRDDGAVLYLNGTEAGRTGMDPGVVHYLTLASAPGVSGNDEFAFFPLNLDPRLLVEGDNVIAVEVHQNLGSSSDVSFALELLVVTNEPPPPPPPTELLRGPYLQRGTPTNLLVCWRTSVPTNGIVRFGLAANALLWRVQSDLATNNQYVLLTNLAPDTKYYYSIGATGTNLAGGAGYYFVTAPAAAKPTRVWAMGDFGTAGLFGDTAPAVRDAYYAFTGPRHTDVWLMLGDNAYSYGRDDEYQRAVFDRYQEMLRKTVAWSTIGNHETYGSNILGHVAYYDIFKGPQSAEAGGAPSGTLHYYSFNYGNIHFVCLDSELSKTTQGGPMATWLREDLSSNTNEWLIAFWHSPPYTKGSHDSDSDTDTDGHLKIMREVFVPILESYGVDLVLSGHSHNYERSFLIDGHYGKSATFQSSMIKDSGSGRPEETGAYLKGSSGPDANQGAVYIVAGSGGFATFQYGQHPVMHTALLRTGSLVLDVDGGRLDGMFLRETGAIEDHFTILKGTAPGPLHFSRIDLIQGTIVALFKTVPGKAYRIQGTASLATPVWSNLSPPIVAIGPTTKWTGPSPAGGRTTFFRVVQID